MLKYNYDSSEMSCHDPICPFCNERGEKVYAHDYSPEFGHHFTCEKCGCMFDDWQEITNFEELDSKHYLEKIQYGKRTILLKMGKNDMPYCEIKFGKHTEAFVDVINGDHQEVVQEAINYINQVLDKKSV